MHHALTNLEKLKLSRKLFPAEALAYLYVLAPREAHRDYKSDLITLTKWLSPIAAPTKQYPDYHDMISSWDVQELSNIMVKAVSKESDITTYTNIRRMITYILIKHTQEKYYD